MDRRKFLQLAGSTGVAAAVAPTILLDALAPLPAVTPGEWLDEAYATEWPDRVWVGDWEFHDGGTLDIGVMHDATLNRLNDFTIFAESFEGLTSHGRIEGGRTEMRIRRL